MQIDCGQTARPPAGEKQRAKLIWKALSAAGEQLTGGRAVFHSNEPTFAEVVVA